MKICLGLFVMCGRYALYASLDAIVNHYQLANGFAIKPRYNISPGTPVPVIGYNNVVDFMSWGYVPGWAKEHHQFKPLINARSETVLEKPAFKESIKKYRCIVPMSGYFEWRKIGMKKQPYFISLGQEPLLSVAAIFSPGIESALSKVAILTAPAQGAMASIHDRMPVILGPEGWRQWLNPHLKVGGAFADIMAKRLLTFTTFAVPKAIGNPEFDNEMAVQPLSN